MFESFGTLVAAIALALCSAADAQGTASQVESATPQNVITGTLKDPAGNPLGGTVIELRASDDRAIAQTQTDRAGAFRCESVPPGNYTLNSETVAIDARPVAIRVPAEGMVAFAVIATPKTNLGTAIFRPIPVWRIRTPWAETL